MNKLINNIDMCILFSQNFNIDYFLIKFYGITKISVKDQYYIDKINLLRNDFTQFWISLDNDNKNKFIQLVINHAKDKDKNLHKINYIDKLCLQCENNKQYLIFIKNRSNNSYNNRCNNNNNNNNSYNNSDSDDSDSDNSDNNNTKL